MKLLITGIHGFIGRNLVSSLKDNHHIYGLDILSPEVDGVIRTYSWDEMDIIPQVDVIIHLAGKAHDTKNQSKAETYFQINTELSKKIYDYYLDKKISKFIFFSTVKAAADKVVGESLSEDIEPKPVGPYGESKIAAENYILTNKPKTSQQYYIFRPSMVHGIGNKGNLNLLYQFISRGIPWPLGAFDNKRSFTSIDNLCFIINIFIDKVIESGIYHISDDDPMSTNELIRAMCEAMGYKVRIWNISQPFIKTIAKLGTILHLPLNTDRLQKLTESYVVNNSKIKKAMGVEFLPVGARNGLIKTIKSFKKIT